MSSVRLLKANQRALLAVLLIAGVGSTACSRLERLALWKAGPDSPKHAIHALAIAPDVDYATAITLDGNRTIYRSDRDLLYCEGDTFYPIVVRGFPRVIGKSPNGNNVAFLEPAEFETAANLYVFDVPAKTLRQITRHEDDVSTLSVKKAVWYNNQILYFLEGYRYGTTSQGGDLWLADVRTLVSRPVLRATDASSGEYREIIDFEFVPGRQLIRCVIAHYDEHGNEFRESYYCTMDGKKAGK